MTPGNESPRQPEQATDAALSALADATREYGLTAHRVDRQSIRVRNPDIASLKETVTYLSGERMYTGEWGVILGADVCEVAARLNRMLGLRE